MPNDVWDRKGDPDSRGKSHDWWVRHRSSLLFYSYCMSEHILVCMCAFKHVGDSVLFSFFWSWLKSTVIVIVFSLCTFHLITWLETTLTHKDKQVTVNVAVSLFGLLYKIGRNNSNVTHIQLNMKQVCRGDIEDTCAVRVNCIMLVNWTTVCTLSALWGKIKWLKVLVGTGLVCKRQKAPEVMNESYSSNNHW